MTASRASAPPSRLGASRLGALRLGALRVWAAALLLALAGRGAGADLPSPPQLAQGSQPIQLFQLPQAPQTAPQTMPQTAPQTAPPQAEPGAGAYQGGGVQGGPGGLGDPLAGAALPEDIGLWTREQGGLGHDLWRGSPRETIATLLGRLDGGVDSPTLRTLALRALLSEAETPGRSLRPVARDGGPEQNLLVLRGRALLALGEPAYLGALLDLVEGPAAEASELLKLKTQAALLTGDYARACASADAGVARDPGDSFWTKARVACQAAEGETDRALLGLDLLREGGEGADEGFSELAAAALGYGKPPKEPAPTPLNIALVLGSELAPPAGWQDHRDPAVVAMAARDGDLGLDRRIALAERAAAGGAVQPDELVGFYESKRYGAEQLADAAARAAQMTGPAARALLFAAARAAQPAARGPLVEPAMAGARADGVELGVAGVFAPLVAELQPAPAETSFAPAAARTLFLAGRYERAAAWLSELRRSAGVNPLARQALIDLWPLARLAGVDTGGGPRDLAAWRAARAAAGIPEAALAVEVVTLRGLLYALGETDSLSFGELIGSEPAGSLTGTSTLLALEQAAVGGRLGETVLLVATVIAENGVGGHPYPTAKAVEALNRVDRPGEARALAMEAAVARGL